MVPLQSAIVSLIYFTGSKYFNRSMQAYYFTFFLKSFSSSRAKKIGYYVCNHAISKADTRGKRIEGRR